LPAPAATKICLTTKRLKRQIRFSKEEIVPIAVKPVIGLHINELEKDDKRFKPSVIIDKEVKD